MVYAGKLVMYTVIDRSTEFPLAYMEKGTIINAHNFLSATTNHVSVKCLTSVTYYYLPYKTILGLSSQHNKLRHNL